MISSKVDQSHDFLASKLGKLLASIETTISSRSERGCTIRTVASRISEPTLLAQSRRRPTPAPPSAPSRRSCFHRNQQLTQYDYQPIEVGGHQLLPLRAIHQGIGSLRGTLLGLSENQAAIDKLGGSMWTRLLSEPEDSCGDADPSRQIIGRNARTSASRMSSVPGLNSRPLTAKRHYPAGRWRRL